MASPISRYGLTVDPPAGWEAVIYRRAPGPGETSHPVIHAASFALPAARGDYGGGAVEAMGPGDALVCLLEFHRSSAGQPLFATHPRPARLSAPDFGADSLQRSLPGQVGVQRFFADAGRAFCLYVVVAYLSRGAAALAAANRLVESLRVDPAGG